MTDLRSSLLDKLDRALAVCEAATPGTWSCWDSWRSETLMNVARIGPAGSAYAGLMANGDIFGDEPDFIFIVHARTALPLALRALRAEVERHVEGPNGFCDRCVDEADEPGDPCRYLCDTAAALEAL